MKIFLIKGLIILFPLFILTGIIGNVVGMLSLYIARKLNKPINSYLNLSIYISFIIGALCFTIMGMFYAEYTFALTEFMKKWLAIIVVLFFIILVTYYSVKEQLRIRAKTLLYSEADFRFGSGIAPYLKNIDVTNASILSSSFFFSLSYIYFLIFNSLIDKISFGLISYLMSFIK